jgi:hypothetical protein
MSVSGRSGADAVLVAVLAAGATYDAAAAQAGVSERTVRRRMDEPEFRQQVDAARADLVTQTTARLVSASVEAVATLEALLGPETPPAQRLGAAKAVIELATRLREQEDLASRITALEEGAKHV